MTRRSKVWLAVAVLFTVVNLVAAVVAAAQGELLHAGVHAALLLPGAFLALRLAPRRYAGRLWRRDESELRAGPDELTERLIRIEQSVEAVAIEVERIGEGQRFMTRLFTEKGIPEALAEGAPSRSR